MTFSFSINGKGGQGRCGRDRSVSGSPGGMGPEPG